MKERTCKSCPAFYEVYSEGRAATGGGWETKNIDGRNVICCRPGKARAGQKPMDRFCFYCLAMPRGKKIGSKASWTGRTPKWCPLGRERKD